jgi:hypothetical protein
MRRWKWAFRTLAAAAAVAMLSTGIALAEKGGKGGGKGGGGGGGGAGSNGGGVIYFSFNNELYTMNDDGAGVSLVNGFPEGYYASGEPSRGLHADKRWFVQMHGVRGEQGPDGYPRDEFVALSDAGDIVQIPIAANLDPMESPRWCVGDEFISWVGRCWDNDPESPDYGEIIEGGLYLTMLAYDQSGNITGLALPSVLLIPFPLVEGDYPEQDPQEPEIQFHDWAPDGSAFVFNTAQGELVIADLQGEMPSFDIVLSGGVVRTQTPRWSPAGDRLLVRYYEGNRSGVWVMNIDGTDAKMVEGYRATSQPYVGVWSPTGSHFLYHHLDHFREDSYIVRTRSDGRGSTRITDQTVGVGFFPAFPLGWRD